MKTIYKYNFKIMENISIRAPWETDFFMVGLDTNDEPAFWARVETTYSHIEYKFKIIPTGIDLLDLEDHYEYFDSFLDGPFVWHVYSHKSNDFNI